MCFILAEKFLAYPPAPASGCIGRGRCDHENLPNVQACRLAARA